MQTNRKQLCRCDLNLYILMVIVSALSIPIEQAQCQTNQPSKYRPVVVQYPPPEIDIPYPLALLQAQVKRSPDNFTIHFYLMCGYAQRGQWEQSLQHALQARRLDRSNVNTHLGTIYAYANLGRWQQAYEAVQASLKLSFDAQARSALLRVKGDLLMDRYTLTHQKNLLQQALSIYQQAQQADHTNIQAIIGIARVEIERRSYQVAKQRLQKALSQVRVNEPGGYRRKALVLYYLGVIEERQGRLKEAERLYQEAVRMHSPSFFPFTEAELKGYAILGLLGLKQAQEVQESQKVKHIPK